jgi:gamma-glutamylputrescine oxidase
MTAWSSASGDATYYQRTAATTAYPPPQHDSEHAICIIGGGFAGLSTALSLIEQGQRGVAVLEAQQIGHGASGRNGGFVFGGFSLGERALVRQLGTHEARALYGVTRAAIATIGRRIDQYAIDCDLRRAGVILADWFGDDASLEARRRFMAETMEVDWQLLPRELLRELLRTSRYGCGLLEVDAFHFHPLQYARGLAAACHAGGAAIHETTPVGAVTRVGAHWRVQAGGRTLRARELVFCCGGYLGRLQPRLARAMLPIQTYVMVTEPLGTRLAQVMRTDAAVYDSRFAFDYYRPLTDSRLLWGGRIDVRQRDAASVARLLRRDLLRVYPQLADVRIEHAWSGTMSYGRHQMPLLGHLADGAWYAMGFGGHGVGPTTAAGAALAAALCGDGEQLGRFARWGLVPTGGAIGLAAAQLSYWRYQLQDAWRGRQGQARHDKIAG